MRIAIITTSSSKWGGSEELWVRAAHEAIRDGHQVLANIHQWPHESPRIVELHRLGVAMTGRKTFAHRRINRWYYKLLIPYRMVRKFKPDVVCISHPGTYDAQDNYLCKLMQKMKTPFVIVNQYNDDGDVQQSRRKLRETREFFNLADKVAFVSRKNLESAQRQMGADFKNGVVVMNPVNMTDRSLVPWPSSGRLSMACVARLDANYKGQDRLIKALATDRWRTRDWRLNFYGTGSHHDRLQDLIKTVKLEDRIRLCGFCSDVRGIWADNHLLVLPSLGEGTPLAMVEAMLCGRPAVVTDVGGNAEWITENQNGFIAPKPEISDIDNALERMWGARERLEAMGLDAHALVTQRHQVTPERAFLNLILSVARKGQ